jgi:multicomponent Na+:H+ antiporter subunit F
MIETTSPVAIGALIAMGFIIAALFLALFRLIRGPTSLDRVVSLDMIGLLAMGFILTFTILSGRAVFLDVAVIMALIIFLGTVAFARYLERSGR